MVSTVGESALLGLNEVLSSCPGQLDFPAKQVTFPDVQGPGKSSDPRLAKCDKLEFKACLHQPK